METHPGYHPPQEGISPNGHVFTAYEAPGRNPHTVWRSVVSTLQEMADRAAPHGVTLALQNHHDIGVATPALLELLNDVDRPNCRLAFDAWSPALRGEDLYVVAKLAAPLTVMTTNADYIRLPRFHYRADFINHERAQPDLVRAMPFGEGFINYPEFFRGLRDGGFDGLANYEMCSAVRGGGAPENLEAYCRRYIQWMAEQGFGAGR
jgi:sugar phosphate isomerase/epimerase